MSLINKMLQDLESRQGVASGATQTMPVYQGLRPSVPLSPRSSRTLLWVGAVILAVAGAGYSVWDRTLGNRAAPAPLSAAASVPKAPIQSAPAAAAPQPIASVAAAPAAAPQSIVSSEPANTSVPAANAAPRMPEAAPKTGTSKPKATKRLAKAHPTPAPPREAASVDDGVVDKRMRPFTAHEKAENLYRQAAALLEQGRSEDAARQLTAAVASDATHAQARELLVGISLKNGRWREAQQLLEEGIAKSPKYYPFVHLLARIYVERDGNDKALRLLENAAALAGPNAEYHSLLATVYQRVGRHADAVASFSTAVELRPQDARTWLGLAISLEAEKKPDAAAQAYQRARQLGGLSPQLATYAEQRIATLKAR